MLVHARIFSTLLTVLLAAPAFALKGLAFYGFLVLILGWFVAACWLWQLTRSATSQMP